MLRASSVLFLLLVSSIGCSIFYENNVLDDAIPIVQVSGIRKETLLETGMWKKYIESKVDYIVFTSSEEKTMEVCDREYELYGCKFHRDGDVYIVVGDLGYNGLPEKEWLYELDIAATMLHEAAHEPINEDETTEHLIISGIVREFYISYLSKHPELFLNKIPDIKVARISEKWGEMTMEVRISRDMAVGKGVMFFLYRIINNGSEVFVYHPGYELIFSISYLQLNENYPICFTVAPMLGATSPQGQSLEISYNEKINDYIIKEGISTLEKCFNPPF